jgi:hypothetical protein
MTGRCERDHHRGEPDPRCGPYGKWSECPLCGGQICTACNASHESGRCSGDGSDDYDGLQRDWGDL